MTDQAGFPHAIPPLAVVGLACRFPDADDPAALLDVVLTGRRSFRRLPPARIDLADYYQADLATSDATYSTRAALIEGWQFERTAFGIERPAYLAADPAHWLALETAARALSAAGLGEGAGLNRDRTGVIIGNTLAGDISRANALRVRWPYVRRVLADALDGAEVPASQAGSVLRQAESSYLAPFPPMGALSLAGSMPGTIATTISSFFGFRGASHVVDSACSSALQAVASACAALVTGDLDAAIAGGVDLSLDPLELIGLAKAGLLATSDVRVYDQHPTGYLPGEGCGIVVLMRAADARAAGLPVYAEILGWGASAGAKPGEAQSQASSQLLAMKRAYERSSVDPADIQFIEGNGASNPSADEAELTALNSIRAGAKRPVALGSVKANIGHAKAAAGAAGLIKTVLALSTGVVPPTTGAQSPHELITHGDGNLVLPKSAQGWQQGARFAAVSSTGIGGSNLHVVLRHDPGAQARPDRTGRSAAMPAQAAVRRGSDGAQPQLAAAPAATPFLLHAADRFALARVLTRIAEIGDWLSDAELHDLACMLGRNAGNQGRVRVAIVAARQEQLALLARQAVTMLPYLADGRLAVRPGIFASDDADGKVTLLLSAEPAGAAQQEPAPAALSPAVTRCLAALRWLDSLDVNATAAVGHGVGVLAGLAWAGALGESEVLEIAHLRAQFLLGSAERQTPGSRTGSDSTSDAGAAATALSAAIAQRFRFGPPRRRLISTMTGADIDTVAAAIELICDGFGGANRLASALTAGAQDVTLLLDTGPGHALLTAAAQLTKVPAISLNPGLADAASIARAAAALFAAGALGDPLPLFAGRPTRPVDIWREQVFITSPCTQPQRQPDAASRAVGENAASAPCRSPGHEARVTGAETQETDREYPPPAPGDGISGRRAEFERRLPAHPLIETAAAHPATVSQREAAAQSRAPDTEPASATEAPAESDAPGQPEEPAQPLAATEPAPESPPIRPARAADHATADHAGPDSEAPGARIAVPTSPDMTQPAGLGAWVRCFAAGLRPVPRPGTGSAPRPWRIYCAARSTVLTDLCGSFTADPTAGRTLAVVDDPADERCCAAAVDAAKDAITTGELVVLTTGASFTGFFASLHAEHPSIGITIVRMPDAAVSPAAVVPFASAEPGNFRELVLGPAGTASEPVLTEAELTGGDVALGAADVIMITRATRGAGLALAHVLACCGAGVAVIGRASEHDDAELVAGFEQLRSAGARVSYEIIDLDDPASLAAAVERIEDRLGTVTAIAHAAGPDSPVLVREIAGPEATARVTEEAAILDLLTGSVAARPLKLIITVGTLASRYGLAGASLHALGSAALAGRAAELAAAGHASRALHVDLPEWSAHGLGECREFTDELTAAGAETVDLSVASRLLFKIMSTPGVPGSLAVHGRVGSLPAAPAPVITRAELAAAGLADGAAFLREVSVHYPGAELVCSAGLTLATDPYLTDYRIDGMPVLPPAIALEALAQAASVLAGRPLRRLANVTIDSPVVIPASRQAALRICALRDGDAIIAALRCADSCYQVDHVRAEFSCTDGPDELPHAAAAPVTAAPATAAPATAAPATAAPAAASAGSLPLQQLGAGPSGLVDGAELYGPVCFQSGRFRRIALLPEVTARSGRALARAADEHPWFTTGRRLTRDGFLLGSPGLNDAVLQVLQACVPHRRVRLAGCQSVQFSGVMTAQPVEIRAIAEPGRMLAAPVRVPGQAVAPASEQTGTGLTEADTVAMEGITIAMEGVTETSRETPPFRRSRRGWRRQHAQPDTDVAADARAAASITAAAVSAVAAEGATSVVAAAAVKPDLMTPPGQQRERAASRSGPVPVGQLWNVEAVDGDGRLLAAWRGVSLSDCGPLPRNAAWPPMLLSVFLERRAAELGLDSGLRVTVGCGHPEGPLPELLSVPQPAAPADGQSAADGRHAGPERRAVNTVSAGGTGPLAGYSLTLRAPVPVACGWVAVEPAHRHHERTAGMAAACAQLRAELNEPPAVLAARLTAAAAALEMAGVTPDRPGGGQLSVSSMAADGWVVFAIDQSLIASAVVELSGVPAPVAVAILTTGNARPGRQAPDEARLAAR